jgi:antitoxin component YwqK of YwqJK toxin-antitoxin module
MKSKGAHKDYFESGLWTYWYDNGNKKSEGFYQDKDERGGKWKFWHSNGQLACIGIHKGWRGDGLWTFWDETGNKVHEREYRELELLDVWENLRADGCSDELVDKYKKYIFN